MDKTNTPANTSDLLKQSEAPVDYLADAAWQFGKGAVHGAIESPINALTQAAGKAVGVDLPVLNLVAPEADSTAGKVGALVGAGVDIYLLNKAASPVFSEVGLSGASAGTQALRMGLVGTAYAGLLQPSDPNSKTFWQDRAKSAAIGGLTFASMGLAASGLDSSGMFKVPEVRSLMGSITYGSTTGAFAGAVNAEASSLLNNGKLASGSDLLSGVGQYAVLGGAFGAAGYGYEQAGRIMRDAQNPLPASFSSDKNNTVNNIVRDAQGNVVSASITRPSIVNGWQPITETIDKMTTGDFVTKALDDTNYPAKYYYTDGMTQTADGSLVTVHDGWARVYSPDGQGIQTPDFDKVGGVPGIGAVSTPTEGGNQKIDDNSYSKFDDSQRLTQLTREGQTASAAYNNDAASSVQLNVTDGKAVTTLSFQPGANPGEWRVSNGVFTYDWQGEIKPVPNGIDGSLQFIGKDGSTVKLDSQTDIAGAMKALTPNLTLADNNTILPVLKVDGQGNITLVNSRSSGFLGPEIDGKLLSNDPGATAIIKPGTNLSIRNDYGDAYPEISNRIVQWGTTTDGTPTADGQPLLPNTVLQLNAAPEPGKVLSQPLAISSKSATELSPSRIDTTNPKPAS